MKKIIFLIIYMIYGLQVWATPSTEKKIKNSVMSLDKSVKKQKVVATQLDKIAKDIDRANRENKKLNKKLEKLSQEFNSNKKIYQISKTELNQYNKSLDDINKKLKEKKRQFIEILASQSSIIYAMSQSHEATRESIVMKEAYQLLRKQNDRDLAKLKDQIEQKAIMKRKIISKRTSAKKIIDKITKQKIEYEKKRNIKKDLLKKLSSSEDQYQLKLQKTLDEQTALRSTLAELNILHKKQVEEEKRIIAQQKAAMLAEEKRKKEERRRRRLARKKAREEGKKVVYNTKKRTKVSTSSVKKIGSSYKRSKIYAYHGGKTISPISGARVVKRFGTYIDPIYKIKIFNQSITLRAPIPNAKVKNVLNGKVVFAGGSSMLGKVVVISHSGKMHTVYAGLSKIAPTIQKGRRIKKGYVIGKVSKKLIFEATKNSKHINPMSLIRL